MARYSTRPRTPLWRFPLEVAVGMLGRLSRRGADNAARALDEEEHDRLTVDAQISQLRDRAGAGVTQAR